MDFRNLQTFIQVSESNSFTRAGDILGYSQPTISFQIKQLEQELGVQLFERIGHTVSLTADGQTALAYAQQILRLSQELVQVTQEEKDTRGTVRVAMADSLCSPLIAQEFMRFREEHPHISLEVTTAGTSDLFRLLDQNEIDLACTLDSHVYNTTYVICSEEEVGVHFVCSSKNPLARQTSVTWQDILEHPFLLTEKGMSYRRVMDEYLARNSLEVHPILEMGCTNLICDLVEENAGIAFLPDFVTEEAVKRGRVVRLSVEGWDLEIWKQIVCHRSKWISAPIRSVIRFLSQIQLMPKEG